MMQFFSVRRPKRILVTLMVTGLGLFVLMSVMVGHLAEEEFKSNLPHRLKVDQEFGTDGRGKAFSQGQRRPKAANLENNSQDERQVNKQQKENPEFYHSYYESDRDDLSDDKLEDMEEDEDDNDGDTGEKDIPDYNPNSVFKPGDFGNISGLEYVGRPPSKQEKTKTDSDSSPELVHNGIYWSSYVESLIPKGLSYSNVTKFLRSIRSSSVQYLKPPGWNRCGRPKNGFVVMDDGTSMCARYRHPHMDLVFGEVLSFYLSRLLRMDNVPAVVLTQVSSTAPQWAATNISSLQWENNTIAALVQWIPDLDSGALSHVKIPPLVLQAYRSGQTVTKATVQGAHLHSKDISQLVQWGTMTIFDYLTANYDRVASMQDGADKEKKPSIIEENIRNLRKSPSSGKLWLIDNESGLLDAYLLLKSQYSGGKFHRFHREMLQTLCVFQSSLVTSLNKLHNATSPHTRLENFAKSHEPLLLHMEHNAAYKLFSKRFNERLKDVIDWINQCQLNS